VGCGSGADRVSTPVQTERENARPADSLVATSPGGTEIWFTLARDATRADGTRCTERGLEIRRGAERVKVPLLYTGTAPIVDNDSTMRAQLWTHCSPGDAYLVDLQSGQPLRDRTGEKER
jgi:hypothetical protein